MRQGTSPALAKVGIDLTCYWVDCGAGPGPAHAEPIESHGQNLEWPEFQRHRVAISCWGHWWWSGLVGRFSDAIFGGRAGRNLHCLDSVTGTEALRPEVSPSPCVGSLRPLLAL